MSITYQSSGTQSSLLQGPMQKRQRGRSGLWVSNHVYACQLTRFWLHVDTPSLPLFFLSYSAPRLHSLPSMATTHGCRPIASAGYVVLPLALLLLTARCGHAQSSSASVPSDKYNPYFGAPSFNPTMAIVIVFLVAALFIVGFLSIYIRHCAGGAADPRGLARGTAAWSRRLLLQQQRGLSSEVLYTFPTLVYAEVKGLKLGKGALECAVCLSEFEDDDALRLLPPCSHAFHPECIDAWLTSHVTCPVCRSNLAEAPNATADIETPTVIIAADPAREASHHPSERRVEEELRRPLDHLTVVVDEAPGEDNNEGLARIEERQRPEVGSRSGRRPPKLRRSHTTGHSVVLPGENVERYTLRLPEHVWREIYASQKLHRSTSCVSLATAAEGSWRRGSRGTGGGGAGEGSSRGGRGVRLGRSDRWPSFFIRTLSAKVPPWATVRRADGGDGSVKMGEAEDSSSGKLTAVRTPFYCLGGGGGGRRPPDTRGESDRVEFF
ncbi:hypothetical protein BHE74_00052464 [Ensete ventricosum]|nr:hypothetical protein BHE74_00052464 [Ensete ventricosum]